MRLKSSIIACAVLLGMLAASLAVAQSSGLDSRAANRANAKVATARVATAKVATANGQSASDWPLYGRDLAGSHHNPHEKIITPANVARLKTKWIFETGGDV